MSQSKMHKITIRNKLSDTGKVMTGASTEVLLDGKPLKGATFVKFEVKAKGVAKVHIEMFADADIEVDLPLELRPAEKIEKNLEPVTVDDEVVGYTSPRYVLSNYSPAKIDLIPKK